VHDTGPRTAAVAATNTTDFYVNPRDAVDGFVVNGTLPTSEAQGVHSLTDVPVYAMGPCQELFGGTYNNVDVFFKMATCFGLAWPTNSTGGADESCDTP
jgi:alkaline phosphatase